MTFLFADQLQFWHCFQQGAHEALGVSLPQQLFFF